MGLLLNTLIGNRQRSKDAGVLFQNERQRIFERTDRMIAIIMCIQWPAAIAAVFWFALRTSADSGAGACPHLIAAIVLGGFITIPPAALACLRPGAAYTRHVIAAGQMLMSALLIHLSGGRIETHFHIFGSLAFLSLYLDWPVLVTATLVILIGHGWMPHFYPLSLFGMALHSNWRLVEHALWIVFFDVFLVISCRRNVDGLKAAAKREADQEMLLHQAYHDALTGLGNRLHIQEVLTRLFNLASLQGTTFALLTTGLDRFKEVNDTLGHQAGDAVLTEAAARLRRQIRSHDTLARMDGDEFAMVLPQCSTVADARRIGERIVECLQEPILHETHAISIGASVGICLYPDAGSDMTDLFHHADLALYKVKKDGGNGYHLFDSSMREETLLQMSLEHRLRMAIRENSLELHYQPIVHTSGTLLGFEALVRWNDAVHGSVSPAEFIPLAEKTSLILPLGNWVLKQACHQAAYWHHAGNNVVKMSVNVSAVQLCHHDFVSTVCNALKETGLPPELLDLELTESVLVQDHENTLSTLKLLRSVGVQLSIDDFGTGYSSFSYLRNLPAHRLKIDRSFVTDIQSSPEARLLIEGMIDMARSLRLSVVAEGVETAAQMAILTEAGCDQIQGFYISRAIPAAAANTLMANSGFLSGNPGNLGRQRRAPVAILAATAP